MSMNHKPFGKFLYKVSLVIIVFSFVFTNNTSFAQTIPSDDAIISAGKALFENNCTQCHGVGDEVVVGPGLKGVHARRPLPWLIKWIRNSTILINSGDAYANEIYNKFGKTQMQSFDFKDEEIVSIVAYIKSESEKAVAAPAVSPAPTDGSAAATTSATTQDTSTLNYILAVFVIILVLIPVSYTHLRAHETKAKLV